MKKYITYNERSDPFNIEQVERWQNPGLSDGFVVHIDGGSICWSLSNAIKRALSETKQEILIKESKNKTYVIGLTVPRTVF